MFVVAHLAASGCVGGPEAQILGQVGHPPEGSRSVVLSFSEGGCCRPLLEATRALGAEAIELRHNAPNYRTAVKEVAGLLRSLGAGVVFCHGYKPDILGYLAARSVGIPSVAVAHGWTAATWKVRLNERLDRLAMRRMDRVICVSEAQARKVRAAGVPDRAIVVIPNAIDPSRFDPSRADPLGRIELLNLFPDPPRRLIGAIGRLSPEKGFGVLVEAAARVVQADPTLGFIHFGNGPLREAIAARIANLRLQRRFLLAGFRGDLPRLTPHFDALVLPSFTEGLPCVVLEAFASAVPVVATAVGGTPEVVEDRRNGRLVPPRDPEALASALLELLADDDARRAAGAAGRQDVLSRFTFAEQSRSYGRLFQELAGVGAPA